MKEVKHIELKVKEQFNLLTADQISVNLAKPISQKIEIKL